MAKEAKKVKADKPIKGNASATANLSVVQAGKKYTPLFEGSTVERVYELDNGSAIYAEYVNGHGISALQRFAFKFVRSNKLEAHGMAIIGELDNVAERYAASQAVTSDATDAVRSIVQDGDGIIIHLNGSVLPEQVRLTLNTGSHLGKVGEFRLAKSNVKLGSIAGGATTEQASAEVEEDEEAD